MSKQTRRTFTAEYKVRIIEEANACRRPGDIGRLLRREGLHYSHLSEWRKVAREGMMAALGRKRGRKPLGEPEAVKRVRVLERERIHLMSDIDAAVTTVEVQRKTCQDAGLEPPREILLEGAERLAKKIGVTQACAKMGVSRSTLYRRGKPKLELKKRPTPKRALSEAERQEVFDVLCSDRFIDRSPRQVVVTLLDEGRYLCSARTMYRILGEKKAVRERRAQRSHPKRERPHIEASRPNQSWSWDITHLRGENKSTYYLYVMMDLFSRYVVGWMVAETENAASAMHLIRETCEKQRVAAGQLTLHSDRGAPMKAGCTKDLLEELGVTRSFSRPRVSNDNPYSEALFKTLKYSPDYPGRFGDVNDAIMFCRKFFQRYNEEHRHQGIRMLTPQMVHSGKGPEMIERRQAVMDAAYAEHPERFVGGRPQTKALPTKVEINRVLPALAIDDNVGSVEVARPH